MRKSDVLRIMEAGGFNREIIDRTIESEFYKEFSLDQFRELCGGDCPSGNADIRCFLDFLSSFEKGNYLAWYSSVKSLGEDNSDNGCRDADDDDESFGEFLLGAYKTGNSRVAYFRFRSGKVVSIALAV